MSLSITDKNISFQRGALFFLSLGWWCHIRLELSFNFSGRAIEHDQSQFEDHDRFMPERFLDGKGNLEPNYETSAFGYGRRGQSASGIMSTLYIYDIES